MNRSLAPPEIVDLRTDDTGRLRHALVETLATASPRRRQALALSALGGLTPAAIAGEMGLSLDTVTVLLQDTVDEIVRRADSGRSG